MIQGFIDGRVGRLSAVIGRPGWSNSISYPYTGIFTQPLEVGKTKNKKTDGDVVCMAMAYMIMACIVMAHRLTSCIATTYIIMAYLVLADIVMACIVKARLVQLDRVPLDL